MWLKGVIRIWFLALIDLTAFPNNLLSNDAERTSSFCVSALPSITQYSHESDLSRVYTPITHEWKEVVTRFKRQDEPALAEVEEVVEAVEDSEDIPEAVEGLEDVVETVEEVE